MPQHSKYRLRWSGIKDSLWHEAGFEFAPSDQFDDDLQRRVTHSLAGLGERVVGYPQQRLHSAQIRLGDFERNDVRTPPVIVGAGQILSLLRSS